MLGLFFFILSRFTGFEVSVNTQVKKKMADHEDTESSEKEKKAAQHEEKEQVSFFSFLCMNETVMKCHKP